LSVSGSRMPLIAMRITVVVQSMALPHGLCEILLEILYHLQARMDVVPFQPPWLRLLLCAQRS